MATEAAGTRRKFDAGQKDAVQVQKEIQKENQREKQLTTALLDNS